MSEAVTIRKNFEAIPSQLGFEPCFVVFNGPPGTSKSLTVAKLCALFSNYGYHTATRVMVDQYTDDLIFQHKAQAEVNGYGSHIFFLDELFLTPDNCDADGKFIIANCTSTAAAPLVAEPKNKGVRVRPCIWFATSNNYFNATPKVSIGAIRRRVSLLVDVPRKGEFLVDGVNYDEDGLCRLVLAEVKRRTEFLLTYHSVPRVDSVVPDSPTCTPLSTSGLLDYNQLPKVAVAKLFDGGNVKPFDRFLFVYNVVGLSADHLSKLQGAGLRVFRCGPTTLASNWEGFLKESLPTDGSVKYC